MDTVEVDRRTYELVLFAARMFGVSPSEVVARAVRAFIDAGEATTRPVTDPWTPIAVHGEYEGQRVEGQYVTATRRLIVTTPPLEGESFKSPSGAATAVVAALNPQRARAHTNGWRFWKITDTDERLEVLR